MGNKEKAKAKQEALNGTLKAIKQDLAGIKFNDLNNNYGLISDMDFKMVCTAITYINGASDGNLETEQEEAKEACAMLMQIKQGLMGSTECINKAIKKVEQCLGFFKDKKSSHSRTTLMKFKKVLEAALNYLSVLNFINWAVGKHFYTILIKAYKKFTSAVLFLKALLVTATNNDSVGGENKKTLLDTNKNLEIPFKLLHETILKLAIKFSNDTLAADDNYKTEEINKVSKKITEANEIISAAINTSVQRRSYKASSDAINSVIEILQKLSPQLIDVSSNKKKGPIKRNFSKSTDFALDLTELITALENFYKGPTQKNLDNFEQLVEILINRILRLPAKAALFPLRGGLAEFLKTLSKLFTVMGIFMNTAQSSEFSEVENTQNPDNQDDRSNTNIHNDNGNHRKITGPRNVTRKNRRVQTTSGLDSGSCNDADSDSSDQPPPDNRNQNKVKQKQSQGGSSKGLQPPGKNNSNLTKQPPTDKQNQNKVKQTLQNVKTPVHSQPSGQYNSSSPRQSPTTTQDQNKVEPEKQRDQRTSNGNDSDLSKRLDDNPDRHAENPAGNSDLAQLDEQILELAETIRNVTRGMQEEGYSFENFREDWQSAFATVAANVEQITALIANSLPKKNKTAEEKNILSTLKSSYKSMQKLAQQKKANKKSFDGYYKKENKNYSKLENDIRALNKNSAIFVTQDSLLYFCASVIAFIETIRDYWTEIERTDNSRNNENNEKQKPNVKPSKKDVPCLIDEACQTLVQDAEELGSLSTTIQEYNYTLDNFARDWRSVLRSAEHQLDLVIQDLDALVAAGGKSWKGFVGKISKALEKKLSRSRKIVILLRELRQLTIDMYENENATRAAWNNYFSAVSNRLNSIRDSIKNLEDGALLYPLRTELNRFREAFAGLLAQMNTYWNDPSLNIEAMNQDNSESSSSGSTSSSPQNNSKQTKPDDPENNHNDSIEEEEEEFSSHSASPRSNGKTPSASSKQPTDQNNNGNMYQSYAFMETTLGKQLQYATRNIRNNIAMLQNPDSNFTQEVPLDHTRPVYDFNNAANIVSYLDTIISDMKVLLPKKKHFFSSEKDPSGHALVLQMRRLRDRIQKFCLIDAPDCKQWQSFYASYQQIMKVLYGDAEVLSDSSSLFQYRGMFVQLFNKIDRLMEAIDERWGPYIRQHLEAAQPTPPEAKKKFHFHFGKIPVENEHDVGSSLHEIPHPSSSATNEEIPSTATGSRRAVKHNTLPSVHLHSRTQSYTRTTDFKHNKCRSKRARKTQKEDAIPGDPGSEFMNATAAPSKDSIFFNPVSDPSSINNDEAGSGSSFLPDVSQPASVNSGRSSSGSSFFGLVSEPAEPERSFFGFVSEHTAEGRRKSNQPGPVNMPPISIAALDSDSVLNNIDDLFASPSPQEKSKNKKTRRTESKYRNDTRYHIADPQPTEIVRNHWESFENKELQMYFALLYGYDFPLQTSTPRKYLVRNESQWSDDQLRDTLEYALIEHIGDFSDKDLQKANDELRILGEGNKHIFIRPTLHKLGLLLDLLDNGYNINDRFLNLAKGVAQFNGMNPEVILNSETKEFNHEDLQALKNAVDRLNLSYFEPLKTEIDAILSNSGTAHRKKRRKHK